VRGGEKQGMKDKLVSLMGALLAAAGAAPT
jgi:hypothetical protein